MSRRAQSLATWTLVLGALAACGGDDASSTSAPPSDPPTSTPDATVITSASAATTAPAATSDVAPPTTSATPNTTGPPVAVVTDARGIAVTVDSTERIIPLDGDVAEIVFALGLGDRVVATDLSATYPPEADALPQIGYQRALDAEPILEFEPSVLLATDIAGPPETLDALERVGVPLVVVPTDPTSAGPAAKIRSVAAALGVAERGEQLAGQVQAEIDAAVAGAQPLDPAPRVLVLYLRGQGTQLVLGADFGTHWLVESAGGVDLADELGVTGSAPITEEALLAAAPDVILVTASGLESVGGLDGLLSGVPALAETPAGQAGAVLAYDDQLMLGNGPRTGAFLATLVADLARLTQQGAP